MNRKARTRINYEHLEARRLLTINVEGFIGEDTVWNDPQGYFMTGEVVVGDGVTLTIEDTVVSAPDDLAIPMRDLRGNPGSNINVSNATIDGRVIFEIRGNVEFVDSTFAGVRFDGFSSLVGDSNTGTIVNSDITAQRFNSHYTWNIDGNRFQTDIYDNGATFVGNEISGDVFSMDADNYQQNVDQNDLSNVIDARITGELTGDLVVSTSSLESEKFSLDGLVIANDAKLELVDGLEFACPFCGFDEFLEINVFGELLLRDVSVEPFFESTFADVTVPTIEVHDGGLFKMENTLFTGVVQADTGSRLEMADNIFDGTFEAFPGVDGYVSRNQFVDKNNVSEISEFVKFSSPSALIVKDNYFEKDADIFVRATFNSDPATSIDLSGNYWGTTDVAEIETRILDRADNSGLPVVDFEPVLAVQPLSRHLGEGDDEVEVVVGAEKVETLIINGTEVDFEQIQEPNSVHRINGSRGNDKVIVRSSNPTDRAFSYDDLLRMTFETFDQFSLELRGFEDIEIEMGSGDAKLNSITEDTGKYLHFDNSGDKSGIFLDGENDLRVSNLSSFAFTGVNNRASIKMKSDDAIFHREGSWFINENFVSTHFFNGLEQVVVIANEGNVDVKGFVGGTNLYSREVDGSNETYFSDSQNQIVASVFGAGRINTQGNSGHDSAYVGGSEQQENVVSIPGFVNVSSPLASMEQIIFSQYDEVAINAFNDIDDNAYIEAESEQDKFVGQYGFASMSGESTEVRVIGFSSVIGEGGGTAHLLDSAGNDLLTGRPGVAKLTDGSFSVDVLGFAEVYVTASEGNDRAFFADGFAGDDVFVAQKESAYIRNDVAILLGVGFDYYEGRSESGNDLAIIRDTVGNDRVTIQGASSVTIEDESGAYAATNGFRRHISESTRGGFDEAIYFHQINEVEYLGGEGSEFWVHNDNFLRIIRGFDRAEAYTEPGERDVENLGEIDFLLELIGRWR